MVMEIHEDQPLVEAGAPPTRQIWVPVVHRSNAYATTQMPPQIANTQAAAGTFQVPHDFTAWTRIRLVVYGFGTAIYNLTVRGDGGTCAEGFTTHTQALAANYGLVAGTFTCIDLSATMAAFFGALSPGDYVALTVTNNTVGTVVVYGFDLRY